MYRILLEPLLNATASFFACLPRSHCRRWSYSGGVGFRCSSLLFVQWGRTLVLHLELELSLFSYNALEEGIDKWSHRRSLGQDNQASKEYEHYNYRKEPKLLALLHERPEFHHKIAHTHLLVTSPCLKLVFHMGRGPRRSDHSVGRT